MSRVVLFHHVLGLTDGVESVASSLREAGHDVVAPDLFEGRTFPDIDSGFAHVQAIGFDEVLRRAERAVAEEPAELVYGGFSLGVMAAQHLLQTRPGARGALLFHAFCEPTQLAGRWPDGTPVHLLGMDADPFLVDDGDLEAARAWQRDHPELVVHLLPGSGHLYLEPSLPDYDAQARERTIDAARSALAAM